MVKPFKTQDIMKVSDYLLYMKSGDIPEKVVKTLPIYPAEQTALAFADFVASVTF